MKQESRGKSEVFFWQWSGPIVNSSVAIREVGVRIYSRASAVVVSNSFVSDTSFLNDPETSRVSGVQGGLDSPWPNNQQYAVGQSEPTGNDSGRCPSELT